MSDMPTPQGTILAIEEELLGAGSARVLGRDDLIVEDATIGRQRLEKQPIAVIGGAGG